MSKVKGYQKTNPLTSRYVIVERNTTSLGEHEHIYDYTPELLAQYIYRIAAGEIFDDVYVMDTQTCEILFSHR